MNTAMRMNELCDVMNWNDKPSMRQVNDRISKIVDKHVDVSALSQEDYRYLSRAVEILMMRKDRMGRYGL